MNALCLILLICFLGVYSAPPISTTRNPLSSTNAAMTTRLTTTPSHSNTTSTTVRSTSVRSTSQRSTTPGSNAKPDNLNNTRQEPQKEESGREAVVFSGICNSEGCVLRGNVYENILPVK